MRISDPWAHSTGLGLRYRGKLWLVFTELLHDAINASFVIGHIKKSLQKEFLGWSTGLEWLGLKAKCCWWRCPKVWAAGAGVGHLGHCGSCSGQGSPCVQQWWSGQGNLGVRTALCSEDKPQGGFSQEKAAWLFWISPVFCAMCELGAAGWFCTAANRQEHDVAYFH